MKKNSQTRREILSLVNTDFEIRRGKPYPFGASLVRGGINFAIYSPNARVLSLVIFEGCSNDILMEFPLDAVLNRTGNVWHAFVRGLDIGVRYGYRVICDNAGENHPQACAGEVILLDPFARATCGGHEWGRPLQIERDGKTHTFRLSLIVDDAFDWEQDQLLGKPLPDSTIYELHVRGYTRHPSAQVKHGGTFLGLTEKIPYLKDLGVTAVELMPVTDFDETWPGRINPHTGQPLYNLWGYDPISFFAPKASYAFNSRDGQVVKEFKAMVKAFHEAGIEVILDMVFNHTGEGDENGPIYHFKGLNAGVFYMIDPQTGQYLNYSGCGNTLNCNHPVVRDMILDSLRYWVTEMHVDGFRFDLASILGRGRDGGVLSNPPLIERIAEDPILAHTKLIAEAWDAAGLYQVGDFPHFNRWMEWNGKFRDDVRRFWRGDDGMVSALATRLAGSSDLYQDDGREPFHSVNFVTCHDGFTLHDLVSYNEKHNRDNGEENRDGSDYNLSWNCGAEGPSQDAAVLELRMRQMRNLAATLLLSQGVPMILAGDEFARTQKGNNNAYCQDNEIGWVDWALLEKNKDLRRFFKILIAFRKSHDCLRHSKFEVQLIDGQPQMSWHSAKWNQPDWSNKNNVLGVHYLIHPRSRERALYMLFNGGAEKVQAQLPPLQSGRWHRVMDSARPAPEDIFEEGREELLKDQAAYLLQEHSAALFIAK